MFLVAIHCNKEPHMEDDAELLDVKASCKFVAGEGKPIDRSTFYRAIKNGLYPKPIHPTPGISRWMKGGLRAARQARIDVAGR
jgi:predicted DNA-binding transcriptional regulator AlpA